MKAPLPLLIVLVAAAAAPAGRGAAGDYASASRSLPSRLLRVLSRMRRPRRVSLLPFSRVILLGGLVVYLEPEGARNVWRRRSISEWVRRSRRCARDQVIASTLTSERSGTHLLSCRYSDGRRTYAWRSAMKRYRRMRLNFVRLSGCGRHPACSWSGRMPWIFLRESSVPRRCSLAAICCRRS